MDGHRSVPDRRGGVLAGARIVVVGAGPNGLTAAARLGRAGADVRIFEAQETPGGAARTLPLLGEGTRVDIGSAAFPFGIASPAFRELRLESHGLTWLHHELPAAHPLEGASAPFLSRSIEETAADLGEDGTAWRHLHGPVVRRIDAVISSALGPLLRVPEHPVDLTVFGIRAPWPARATAAALLRTERARALFAGSAAHATLPMSHPMTSAFAVLFGAAGHAAGWPVPQGGAQAITDALLAEVRAHGGTVQTDCRITHLAELPANDAVLLDLTPRQVLAMGGLDLPRATARPLRRWRYGAGIAKVDLLLDGPAPWTDPVLHRAGTLHMGGTLADLDRAEMQARRGRLPERPFVMAVQPSLVDPTRAPSGQHVLWAYAHVPEGCRVRQATEAVVAELERHAPRLRERIIARSDALPADLQAQNENLVGGTIGGGSLDGLQQVLRPRPALDPYALSPGVWMCSSSTPPGGGVHGMAGWHAAASVERALSQGR